MRLMTLYKLFRFIVHNIHAYVSLCNEKNMTICCKFPHSYITTKYY